MRPEKLLPGDILAYKKSGIVGGAISIFEPGKNTQYAHVAGVFDDEQACEMNPPKSRLFHLDDVPWDVVDVYRIYVEGICPFLNDRVVAEFRADVSINLNKPYNGGYIFQLFGFGVAARYLGLGKPVRWLMSRNNPFSSTHADICSTWIEERLQNGVRVLVPNFDLFPDLGENRVTPANYPSMYMVKIS